MNNFDLESYMQKFGDFSNQTFSTIIEELYSLDEKNRNLVLQDERIRTNLKKLFKEAPYCQQNYLREISKFLNVEEILNLLDKEYIQEVYSEKNTQLSKYKCIFFGTLLEINTNSTLKIVLKDDELFQELFKINDQLFYGFKELDYSLLVEIVRKIERLNINFPSDFMEKISDSDVQELLKEPFKDETVVWFLKHANFKALEHFFMNDKRAWYLYSRLDFLDYARKGGRFNEKIMEQPNFFELLKSSSLIQFRNNINTIEIANASLNLQKKIMAYYEEILNSYDKDSNLFKEYEKLLDNPTGSYPDLKYEDNCYLINSEMNEKLKKVLECDKNDTLRYGYQIREFLQEQTSRKISEIVIDALFQDTIYNVWLNIEEMLRYNESLPLEEKTLDKSQINFYQYILRIDNISNQEKIELYNKLKNKKIYLMFYEDIRKIKNLCYQKIKNDLIHINEHPEYVNKYLSNKHGVLVYDYRDREYTMLIRVQFRFRERFKSRRNCYSLISHENSEPYTCKRYIYGYESFSEDRILHVFESDSFSVDTKYRDNNFAGSSKVNRIMTPRQIVTNSKWYSEIQIVNKKIDKETYEAVRPDYLVCYSQVDNNSVEEAKRLEIPIILIEFQKRNISQDIYYDWNDGVLTNYTVDDDHKMEELRFSKRRLAKQLRI